MHLPGLVEGKNYKIKMEHAEILKKGAGFIDQATLNGGLATDTFIQENTSKKYSYFIMVESVLNIFIKD